MKDEGRPLGDGLQDQSSNRPALRGPKNPGGERTGKRRGDPRQVWTRKANESEPLMRHRKGINAIETRLLEQAWDKARKGPAYGPGGGRCRGGASLVQAFMWNVGTECSDVKGEIRGENLQRVRLPKRSAGTDWFVVAMKPGNAGGAKGPGCSASGVSQPEGEGAHV